MVPIKEAIDSGSWLHCEYESYSEIFKFRLKINSFRKLILSEIDNPEKIDILDKDCTLWIMQIEFINLCLKPISPHYGPVHINVVDQDGFHFNILEDYHLENGSNFSKTSGMVRFHKADLIPKIKAVGSIIFQLPNDDEAEYSITLKDGGTVQEV